MLPMERPAFVYIMASGRNGTIYILPRATFAIGESGWNKQLILRTGLHHLQRFRPSLDDAIHGEGRWFIAFIRTVELSTVDERAAIVGYDGIRFLRRRAAASRKSIHRLASTWTCCCRRR